MKRLLFVLGILGLFPGVQSSDTMLPAQITSVSIGLQTGHAGYFYSSLRPYGEWIELRSGFYAWRPVRVRAGWRPYMNGRWAWTDYGWYWMSYEPFGWAVFHYGRWYFDEYYGWMWIPDDVWGPSWVEWRSNDDYIGWAPLPPYASFSISIGIRFTTQWYAPSNYWCFVRYGHFSANRIDGYVVNDNYTRRLIRTTRSAVRYEVDRDRIINRGIDREIVERRGSTRIQRMEVGETRNRGEQIVRNGSRERIEVYRPSRSDFERGQERIEARRPDRTTTLNLDRVERGGAKGSDRSFEEPRQKREPAENNRESQRRDRQQSRGDQSDQQNQRITPDQRERSNEFRRVQPEQPSVQRRSESPVQRRQPSVQPQPRRENPSPQRQISRSRGNKRGRDQ